MAKENTPPKFPSSITAPVGNLLSGRLKTLEKRKKEILKREKSEATRYKKYYGIDVTDTSIYDAIIDAGDKTPEQIMEIIVRYLRQ